MIFFRQCELRRRKPGDEYGFYTTQTSWIPEQFAHAGNYVKLKREDGSWEDGWLIHSVGTRLEEQYVLDHERDAKNFHKAQPLQRGNK